MRSENGAPRPLVATSRNLLEIDERQRVAAMVSIPFERI